MEQLRQEKPLPAAVGDFARLVIVFVTYLEASAISRSVDNFLLADQSLADKLIDEGKTTALRILEALKAEARHDSDLPLRSSLKCHIDLTLMLLFTPRTEVVNHAQSFKTELEAVPARERLRHWIDRDAGRHARHAIAAAGALTGLLQSNSTRGFYEPIAALLATLTLWTYSQMVESASTSCGFIGTVLDRTSGGGRTSTVRLDNFREAGKAREWVNGSESVRAHIKDVGNICKSSAGSRILVVGKAMITLRTSWMLSQGLGLWLSMLRSRADKGDTM